jgi:hypothetical protein
MTDINVAKEPHGGAAEDKSKGYSNNHSTLPPQALLKSLPSHKIVFGTDGRIISTGSHGNSKKNPVTAAIYQQDHFLPKVPGAEKSGEAQVVHDIIHAKFDGSRPLTSSEINIVMDQVNKLKALMREKDLDLLKLRHENVILKQVRDTSQTRARGIHPNPLLQIERRQQKDIEQLDAQNQDAPRLIRGLRDEISGLKVCLCNRRYGEMYNYSVCFRDSNIHVFFSSN